MKLIKAYIAKDGKIFKSIEEADQHESNCIGISCEDCGTTKDVSLQPCPYAEELYGDYTEHQLCDDCCHERAQDI